MEVSWKRGTRLNMAGIICVALSLGAFGRGVLVIAFAMPWAFSPG
jgi:hypothetical protein